jgi:hypothetical protein
VLKSQIIAALESLDAEVGTNRAWETMFIRGNMKFSGKESLGYY